MCNQFFMSAEFDTEHRKHRAAFEYPFPDFLTHAYDCTRKTEISPCPPTSETSETEKLEKERKRQRQRAGRPGSGSFTSCHGVLS